MSVVYHQAQKQRYRVTLEFDVLADFDPHNMDWEKTFQLEPAESVSAYVEDLSTPDTWQSKHYWALALTPSGPLKVYLQCKGHSRPATHTLMTQRRTATYTNVQDKVKRTVEFPDYSSAMQFVLSLHAAGVDAEVNLLPEDVAA